MGAVLAGEPQSPVSMRVMPLVPPGFATSLQLCGCWNGLSIGHFFNCNILGATCVCPELIDIENENISLDLE